MFYHQKSDHLLINDHRYNNIIRLLPFFRSSFLPAAVMASFVLGPLLPCKKQLPLFRQWPDFIIYNKLQFIDLISDLCQVGFHILLVCESLIPLLHNNVGFLPLLYH